MQIISILSSHPQTGTTTVAVNIAKGLQIRGYRVIMHAINGDHAPYDWLGVSPVENNMEFNCNNEILPGMVTTSSMGVDVFLTDEQRDSKYYNHVSSCLESQGYDYLILDLGSQQENLHIGASLASVIIACTNLLDPDEADHLGHLNKLIENCSSGQKGINLVVPCKVDTKGWNNSQVLFSIADRMGYENIADIIPACERIHLLPGDHKHVWDLSQQNLRRVFDNLVSRLEI